MKSIARCIAIVIVAALLFQTAPVSAERPLSTDEIAERLWCLGLLCGCGSASFELDRWISRAEAAVLGVRLLGLEEQAQRTRPRHPFRDVPAWADGAVGCLWENGLLDDTGGGLFHPDHMESAERFARILLTALGWRNPRDGRLPHPAAETARALGILPYPADVPLTRAAAVRSLYRTLCTPMRGRHATVADRLTAAGKLDPAGAAALLPGRDRAKAAVYIAMRRQAVTGVEYALYPAESLVVTQGAYEDYSHGEQNAVDLHPAENVMAAPFSGQIVRIDPGEAHCNAVWIESRAPVRFADGTVDWITVSFLHDDDVTDLAVGQELSQGERFYDCGCCGVSTGAHVHVAVYRGRYRDSMKLGSGDVRIEDALWLCDTVTIIEDGGLRWHLLSEENAAS